MIIFGTRGVKSTLDQGSFNCPQCECNKAYKHKKVTRFFTLYFIPIIPLGKLGEYVECQSCKGTFITNVLNYQKSPSADQFLSQYEIAMKHTMVLIMLADGEIDDNEMATVLKIVNKFGHNDITLQELQEYVIKVQRNPEEISTYLKGISPLLNLHGKESIIKCAIAVAASDGNIDASEMKLIYEMAKVMEMNKKHFDRIIEEIKNPEPSFSAN